MRPKGQFLYRNLLYANGGDFLDILNLEQVDEITYDLELMRTCVQSCPSFIQLLEIQNMDMAYGIKSALSKKRSWKRKDPTGHWIRKDQTGHWIRMDPAVVVRLRLRLLSGCTSSLGNSLLNIN